MGRDLRYERLRLSTFQEIRRYDGLHGPIDVVYDEDFTTTTVSGPEIPLGRIDAGPQVGIWDLGGRRQWSRDGTIGGVEFTVSQEDRRRTSTRVMRIESSEWKYTLPSFTWRGHDGLTRRDGSVLCPFNRAEWLRDDVEPFEVALLVLIDASELTHLLQRLPRWWEVWEW